MAAGEDVGVLVARLVADTEGLRRDMQRANQTLASNTAKMNRHLARTTKAVQATSRSFKFLTTGIGAAAIAMAGRFVKAQLDSASQLKLTAEAIGFQVEGLQVLRFAAIKYGLAQNTVDMGLQRFSRRIAEARKGGGELIQVLIDNNIRLTEAGGKLRANEDILMDFAEALNQTEDAQERLRMAFKAFDSEGARPMVKILGRGRQGLADFEEQTRNLGVILDKAMIQKAHEGAVQFNILANVLRTQLLVAISENASAFAQLGGAGVKTAGFLARSFSFAGNLIGGTAAAAAAFARGDFAGAKELLNMSAGELADPTRGAGGGVSTPGAFSSLPGAVGSDTGGAGVGGAGGAMEGAFQAMIQPFMRLPMVVKQSTSEAERLVADSTAQIIAHYQSMADKYVATMRDAEQQVANLRAGAVQNAVGLLQALGGKHRGAAIAALAVQKALAIQQVLISSKVAAMRALADLGPIAGPPVAAKFIALGHLNAGLIAATGLVQASQISRGGGGLGTNPAQPLFTQDSPITPLGTSVIQQGSTGSRTVNVIFQGPFVGWNEQTQRAVVAALQDAVNGRDEIIISGTSRQAEELRRGGR